MDGQAIRVMPSVKIGGVAVGSGTMNQWWSPSESKTLYRSCAATTTNLTFFKGQNP